MGWRGGVYPSTHSLLSFFFTLHSGDLTLYVYCYKVGSSIKGHKSGIDPNLLTGGGSEEGGDEDAPR